MARPRVGLGVALVRAGDGAVLVGTRLGSHGAGQLAFPGGHLEGGEGWAACAAREVAEEAGLALDPARFALLGVTNDLMPPLLHYVTLFLGARVSAAEAAAVVNGEPHKCAGWAWVQLAALAGGGARWGSERAQQQPLQRAPDATSSEPPQRSADDGEARASSLLAAAPEGTLPMFTSLRNFITTGLAAGLASLPPPPG